MKIKLLDIKKHMEIDGIKILDLSGASFKVNYYDPRLVVEKIMIAEAKHMARPDLISYEMYRSVDHADVILKFNQITNPFSINEGDLIIAPNLVSIDYFYEETESNSEITTLDTKFLFIDPTRASKKDQNRLNQLERIAKSRKNGAKEIKPTNLLRKGEAPFKADKGALRLSPDNSKSRNK